MASFSQSQVDIGNTILNVGRSVGATDKQLRAAFAAAWVESRFQNLNYGDRDSLGIFQQRPSQGWGTTAQVTNPTYAAGKFFQAVKKVSQSGTPGQLAQRVQRSGFPARYDEQIATSDELLNRLGGTASGYVVGGNNDAEQVANSILNDDNPCFEDGLDVYGNPCVIDANDKSEWGNYDLSNLGSGDPEFMKSKMMPYAVLGVAAVVAIVLSNR